MSESRIDYIDFLKFIGLTGIIIAHCNSPEWVMMLRSFDVPLMVILSSILSSKSYSKYKNTTKGTLFYWLNRIKRLVIPTWIFLALFFFFEYSLGIMHNPFYYIASFGLTRYGIGYVWIILIYLYSAFLIPLVDKLKDTKYGVYVVGGIYILYEIAYLKGLNINKLTDSTIFYIIPYGMLTFLGYSYSSIDYQKKKQIILFSMISFLICALYYWYSNGYPTIVQVAKYPPRLYYLSYGIVCSFLLLRVCEIFKSKIYKNYWVRYISANSMGIYFAHIFVLKVIELQGICRFWLVKFVVTYFCSYVIVYTIKELFNSIISSR